MEAGSGLGRSHAIVALLRHVMLVAVVGVGVGCSAEPSPENVASVSSAVGEPTTYYVSSSIGSDANTGLEGQPWKTLDAIYAYRASFVAGDRILLKRGDVFPKALLLRNMAGTAQAPITIGAYGTGDKPVISAGGAVLDWQPVVGHDGCASAGIASPNYAYGNIVKEFFYEGVKLAEVDASVSPTVNLDLYLTEMLAQGSWGPEGYGPLVYFCHSDLAGLAQPALQTKLRAEAKAFHQGVVLTSSSHLVLEDIEVNEAYQGIAIAYSDHVTLRRVDTRNTVHFAVNLASVGCGTDCSDHISILDSTIQETAHNAIWMNGARHVKVSGNVLGPVKQQVLGCCRANNGDLNAVGIKDSSNIELAHNKIYGEIPQESGIDVAQISYPIDGVSIHHNFISGTTGSATIMGTNLDFHHNIFVGVSNPDTETRKRLNGVKLVAGASGVSTVYNNVLYGVAGTAGGIIVSAGADEAPVYVMNNVIYAVNPTSSFSYLEYYHPQRTHSRNNAFFSTTSVAYPVEAHSVTSGPVFVSTTPAAPDDFRLASGSALLGAGVDPKLTSAVAPSASGRSFDFSASMPTFDAFWGHEGAGLDIGAYEASGTSPSSLAAGLILSERFDEQVLTEAKPTLIDASGFNYHGKPYGGVTRVAGQLDGAVELDGTDDRIEYGTLGAWNPTAVTLSFWMKSDGVGAGGVPRLFSRKLTVDYFPSTDKVSFEIGATTTNSIAKTTSLTEGVWHHIVCTYDDAGDRMARVYVDGALNVTGTAVVGSLVSQASQILLVGKHTSQANYFKGQLDELNIWNRVLNSSEIASLYNGGTGGTGLIVQPGPTHAVLAGTSPSFLHLATANYGSVTGATAMVPAGDKGATLSLTGSGWKRVLFNYTVTTATRLAFDFRSTGQGDIHGIGLDTDDTADSTHTFQLYGTAAYGQQDHHDYGAHAANGFHHYDIPLGSKYTGAMSRIFFANQGGGAASEFSNVYLYEAP